MKRFFSFDALTEYFTGENHFSCTVWIFRRAVYLFLLANTLTLLPVAGQLWGPDSLLMDLHIPHRFCSLLLYSLYNKSIAEYFWLFIAGQLIFLLLGLFGKFQRFSAIAVFLFTENLLNRAQLAANGSYHIILLMLFYLIFMDENKMRNFSPAIKILNNASSNFALIAARIQLALLYAASGIYKLLGDSWSRGEALYYTLCTDEFSHPLVKKFLISSDWFVIGGNYFSLLYQLLFPILIWFNKTRFPLLLAGVALHLCIAFMMGLMDFGFAMIVCYFVFSTSETPASLKAGIRRMSRKGD